MFFLALCLAFSAVAYVPQWFVADRRDLRTALRHGLAAGFMFTGVDHFVHTQQRYVPMMPGFLSAYATELVYVSGAAELAGALGLIVPLALSRRLGLPHLRRWAGLDLTMLLGVMVIANVNVARQGQGVEGLDLGPWYAWLRPLLQPVIMAWALYVEKCGRDNMWRLIRDGSTLQEQVIVDQRARLPSTTTEIPRCGRESTAETGIARPGCTALVRGEWRIHR